MIKKTASAIGLEEQFQWGGGWIIQRAVVCGQGMAECGHTNFQYYYAFIFSL